MSFPAFPSLTYALVSLLACLQVVVLRKRDFLDLDNPLLAWMLDYDAVSAVLKALPAFKKLKQEQMEHIFDRFEARQELYQGDVIVQHGEPVSVSCSHWVGLSSESELSASGTISNKFGARQEL